MTAEVLHPGCDIVPIASSVGLEQYLGVFAALAVIARGVFNLKREAHVWIVWLLGAGAAILAIWIVWKTAPRLSTAGRMQFWKAALALLYLYLCTALLLYAVYGVWASAPPQAAQPPKQLPTCAPSSALAVKDFDPDLLAVGATLLNIRVLGCGFESDDKLAFNGSDRQFTFIDASQLVVGIAAADLAAPGSLTVVVTKSAATSAGLLRVAPSPEPVWWFFGWHWQFTDELRFLVMVLLTGALGSSVFALKSFADYLGNEKLSESWFTFYLIQPIEGAGIAFVFYVVVRGGFFSGTSTDLKTVNMFGVCAIAALAGMFSDTAFQKLNEVFVTMFRSNVTDARTGKIDGPKAGPNVDSGASNDGQGT